MLADLWDGGLDGSNAGVLAGFLAQLLELIISRIGAVIVLLAANTASRRITGESLW